MSDPVIWDKIKIEDLIIPCIIGIADKERISKQNVTINITMFADISRACLSDDINDTINYKIIKNRVKDFVLASDYFLIEKMAEQIAGICFDEPRVEQVIVKVEKPAALTLARSVSVEITRKRSHYGR